jgi:hypothetical protein
VVVPAPAAPGVPNENPPPPPAGVEPNKPTIENCSKVIYACLSLAYNRN